MALTSALCVALCVLFFSTLSTKDRKDETVHATPSVSTPSSAATTSPEPTADSMVEVQPTTDTTSDTSLYRIVNAEHPLSRDYVPQDLVEFENGQSVRQEVIVPLTELFSAARQNGYSLSLISGYRSYDTQVDLYTYYADTYGKEYAERIDDKPGECEHQLGLLVDLGLLDGTCQLEDCFGTLQVSRWLEQNAYLYGFIERYPEGKEGVTGIVYSPWNYRYVGEEEARKIHDSGLTMEEYYGQN